MNTILVAAGNGRSRAVLLSRWSRLALSLLVLGLPLCAGVLAAAPAEALALEQRVTPHYVSRAQPPAHSGDVVRNGQVVALLSSLGRTATPHRDIGAFRHGRQIDPATYFHFAGR